MDSAREPKMAALPGCLRFWRFSFVGLLGFTLQIALLKLLTQAGVKYLAATALAVEAAVLHNFLWHLCYTWPDRQTAPNQMLLRFLRFQLSNGVASLLGNLALMYLLVDVAQWPLAAANLVTVLCCSAMNFVAGDRWVFATSPDALAAASAPVAHQQQTALREGNVDQCRCRTERQAQPDLRSQQERSQRPQSVKDEKRNEKPLEASAQVLHIERNCRGQEETNGYTDNRRHHNQGDDPVRLAKHLLKQVLDSPQPCQNNYIEAEIHRLDKKEKNAHRTARGLW